MRTQGAFYADTPHGNGFLFFNASQLLATGNFALTRNALGDYSYNLSASQSGVIVCGLADLKRLTTAVTTAQGVPTKAALPFQEQFGTSSGATGYPAGAPGLPPFTDATELTPPTAMPPKGIRVYDVIVAYLITGAAATTNAFSMNRVTFANNVANSIVNVPVTGSLATAVQANPYVTKLTVNSPTFEVADQSDLVVEVNVATTTSGAYRFYGFGFHVDFNYN